MAWYITRGAHHFLSELLKCVPGDNVWYARFCVQPLCFANTAADGEGVSVGVWY